MPFAIDVVRNGIRQQIHILTSTEMLPLIDDDPNLSEDERRQQARRGVLVRARVEIPGKLLLSGHAVDISQGGLGLQCNSAVAVGQQVRVTVPFDVLGERREIVITARVCYCTQQTESHFRLGLQFVDLDPDAAAFIAAVCG